MLTQDLKSRLKAITDVFQEVDGISYEQAVEMKAADANPAKNISIFEEMVRVYQEACARRPMDPEEKQEIYKILLLRSFYAEEAALAMAEARRLSREEVAEIIKRYQLEAEPAALYME